MAVRGPLADPFGHWLCGRPARATCGWTARDDYATWPTMNSCATSGHLAGTGGANGPTPDLAGSTRTLPKKTPTHREWPRDTRPPRQRTEEAGVAGLRG